MKESSRVVQLQNDSIQTYCDNLVGSIATDWGNFLSAFEFFKLRSLAAILMILMYPWSSPYIMVSSWIVGLSPAIVAKHWGESSRGLIANNV